MTWLAAPLLGLPRGVWIIVAVATVVFGLVLWVGAREEADDRANQEIGAAVQREGDLVETITRTEQGNAAREAIEATGADGDALRYEQCLRTARTPANCKRFLPVGSTD